MNVQFKRLTEPQEFETLERLAAIIWREHYASIIGLPQVEYMLQNFQQADQMFEQSKQPGYQYYIGMLQNNPMGYFSFSIQATELFLSKFYLTKACRGKGYGRAMLSYIEALAIKSRMDRIRLTVNKNNLGAISAYEALDFERVGSIVIDIGGGYIMDDFEYVKKLS